MGVLGDMSRGYCGIRTICKVAFIILSPSGMEASHTGLMR